MNSQITSHYIHGRGIDFYQDLLGTWDKTHRGTNVPERLCVTAGIGSRFIRETPEPCIYHATEHLSTLSFNNSLEV